MSPVPPALQIVKSPQINFEDVTETSQDPPNRKRDSMDILGQKNKVFNNWTLSHDMYRLLGKNDEVAQK